MQIPDNTNVNWYIRIFSVANNVIISLLDSIYSSHNNIALNI
jgi:hypothetical protein